MVSTRFTEPEMGWPFGQAGAQARGAVMPMDAYERDNTYTLRFDLAGVDPDDVDITVESGTLTVTARRAIEETEDVNWLVRERPTGIHSRQVRLGERLDLDHIGADYANGVLTVTIPVRPESQRRRVPVTSGRGRTGHETVDVEPSGQ